MFKITGIPAFTDNYIWAIHNDRQAVLVDPGEALPALVFLSKNKLELTGILCTHRHYDHIGGITKLREVYNVPVYGRAHPDNPHITKDLREGDTLKLNEFDLEFNVIETPGHLNDHISFISPKLLFCGDVLFGAGCGRNKEGTLAQLHHSLERLSLLPPATKVYCAHEYTDLNIPFALVCEPDNQALRQRAADTTRLRNQNLPTVPSTIEMEHATNPFLRCTSQEIIRTLKMRGLEDTTPLSVFSALRLWRNQF